MKATIEPYERCGMTIETHERDSTVWIRQRQEPCRFGTDDNEVLVQIQIEELPLLIEHLQTALREIGECATGADERNPKGGTSS